MKDRVLALEGVHNFRDFGGYPVSGGGRLRRGVLWRSGQHHSATDSDLEKIAALGLASVFDLRTSKEREIHPCRRHKDFDADVFYCEDPVRMHAPHLAAAQITRQRTAESTRESLLRSYAGICFRPELQTMIRQNLSRMAEGGRPGLVNCMAGKDRTGIAVAMLHLSVGVHRDDIFEDYLLTNTAGDTEARIAAGAKTVRAFVATIDDDAVRVLMCVEPEYLESAFNAIEEQHGSIDAYLEQVLGIDGPAREKLRAALVED